MFNHDILIIDIESTGLDYQRNELIELAGVLLDKKTLKEKKHFRSFIKPQHWRNRDPEAMAINKITWEELAKAPSLKTVINTFQKKFGDKVILAPYGTIMDTAMLRVAYKKIGKKYPYDYHVFDVWPLCYTYMAKKKLLVNKKRFSGFSLNDIANHFKIKIPANRHTALADCRLEAEVLRKLVKTFKV